MKFFVLVISVVTLIFAACDNKPKDPTVAIVNGVEIKESQTKENSNLDKQIETVVLETESRRIGLSENEMLGFFDSLKTRKIPKDQVDKFMEKDFKDKSIAGATKTEILKLMREKQYEEAKKKYISELKNRSTIWVIRNGNKVKYETSQK